MSQGQPSRLPVGEPLTVTQVAYHLEDIVSRLDRLGDRLAAYAGSQEGHDGQPPAPAADPAR